MRHTMDSRKEANPVHDLAGNKWLKKSVQTLAIIGFLGLSGFAHAQYYYEATQAANCDVLPNTPITPSVFVGDLRNLPKARVWQPGDPDVVKPDHRGTSETTSAQPLGPTPSERDPLLRIQEASGPPASPFRSFTTPDLNFAGQGWSGVRPPDTVGDVGGRYYIQMTNDNATSLFTVYDKSDGSVVVGPLELDDLWAGGGDCASHGSGDPIVVYDQLARRWLMSEFVEKTIGNHLCVYISRTANPVTGGWYNYDFEVPRFPDFPKYAVWPDAYYVSTNEGDGTQTPTAYALERAKMLAGQAANGQRCTATALGGFGFQALTPSDLDGGAPAPAGSPDFFLRHRDDEVHNPGTADGTKDFLEIWEFAVDFANAANTTFTLETTIDVTSFDSDLCGTGNAGCIPQENTSVKLDPVKEVAMWRVQYRNFGTHEAMVGNFVIDADGSDRAGIRWFELRRQGGAAWSLYQEGTYAPADVHHRWLGSIAMDGSGNIALGYSINYSEAPATPKKFPSIRYVGRVAADPLGQLTTGEVTIIGGTGEQENWRWGDYSSMNVDPVNDCTFWYTNEYIGPNGGHWETRIASFRFPAPTCVDAPPIPAISEWGLAIMALLALTAGTIIYGRRRWAAA